MRLALEFGGAAIAYRRASSYFVIQNIDVLKDTRFRRLNRLILLIIYQLNFEPHALLRNLSPDKDI
jgi:hypothetical protein